MDLLTLVGAMKDGSLEEPKPSAYTMYWASADCMEEILNQLKERFQSGDHTLVVMQAKDEKLENFVDMLEAKSLVNVYEIPTDNVVLTLKSDKTIYMGWTDPSSGSCSLNILRGHKVFITENHVYFNLGFNYGRFYKVYRKGDYIA